MSRREQRRGWKGCDRERQRVKLVGFGVVVFVVGLVLMWGRPQGTDAQSMPAPLSCSVEQLTATTTAAAFNSNPSINADGTRIVFVSSANLTGGNPDGTAAIFLFDTTTSTFTRFTAGGNPFSFPSINADGTRIAFESFADLTGGNPKSSHEIFLFDTTTSTFTQLTTTTGFSLQPSINADGTRIALATLTDLTGEVPTHGELFLFDTTTRSFTQLTATTAGNSLAPSINADGTRIAFHSTIDLTGDNPDGTAEIFCFDITTRTLTQLTATIVDGSFSPSINADGTRIAFVSSADLTGDNPDGSTEVFLVDVTTRSFTQLTATTAGQSLFPSINADGTRIAFMSSADLAGSNSDGNDELFLVDTATRSFTQLTVTTVRQNFFPSINADGTRITFASRADLTGDNPDGNTEIFLASCEPVAAPPANADAAPEQNSPHKH